MRILLDTNIIIHREAGKVKNPDIGILFNWIDKLKAEKCVHPLTILELKKHVDIEVVKTMEIKVANYTTLKTQAPFDKEIKRISDSIDKNTNDITDSKILAEVFAGRVDILISEDKNIHTKAKLLNISDKVFKIDTFLEKVIAEHPELTEYKVLAVKKQYFGEVNIEDKFFDSFRNDYAGFDKWFNKKSDEISYVCYHENNLSAFLFLKLEDENENYMDISPVFEKKRRLKIGTFKVIVNGYKIGERFLKIIFDNAFQQKVDEIYVTIFDKTDDQLRLIELIEKWGFILHGIKTTSNGQEKVFVRAFKRNDRVDIKNPKLTYPFISKESNIFIVPIYPEYHTELFPDSILNTESPKDYVENEPHRNALSKVYISRSHERNLNSGDIIVFYRTGGKYAGVATTIGVVESVIADIKDESQFMALCRKRSVFTDKELKENWNYKPSNRPFIVNFLYVASYPKRPNLDWLIKNKIIPSINEVPRGFMKITRENFINIAEYAYTK